VERIVSTVAAIAAGLVANQALKLVWKGITGHTPPDDEKDADAPIPEIVIFAAVSGALVALARTYANRGAHKWLASGAVPKQ